jgi:squalene synthase HpnC
VEDIVGEASPERREGEAADRDRNACPALPAAFLEKLVWPAFACGQPNHAEPLAPASGPAANPAAGPAVGHAAVGHAAVGPAANPAAGHDATGHDAVGPPVIWAERAWSLAAAQAYCRQLSRKHYENFTVAGWLTPAELRQPIADIYAFCRWADDLADELPGGPAARLAALDWWQAQLAACWQPWPSRAPATASFVHPVFLALRATRERFDLDIEPFTALLAAFRQDQIRSRYDTWEELLAYCQNSAAPVGRLLLRLARLDDRRSPEWGEWSDAICAGLQIANFCQDLRGDSQRGRIYLPREAWHPHAVSESDFFESAPSHRATAKNGSAKKANPNNAIPSNAIPNKAKAGGDGSTAAKLAPVVREGVELAARLFQAGRPLLTTGPAWLRSDLALFLGGGEAILQAIRNRRYDVWTARPVVSRWAKWRLLPVAVRAFLAARRAT